MENQEYYYSIDELIKHYNYKILENWEECKNQFKEIIPDPFYSHFIKPLYAFYDEYNNIILYVENEKLQNHIEIRYSDIITHIVYNFYKNTYNINKVVFFNKKRPTSENIFKHTTNIASNNKQKINDKKEIWDLDLFYPSKENYKELTYLIKLEKYFRPIFIYGPSGCGKTSLAKTWKKHHSKIIYFTIPEFISEFVHSIKKRNSIEWLDHIKSQSILILDDFQLLKPTAIKCMEEIRNLIDYFHEQNKIFIILSDRDFQYLKLEQDILSRMMTFHKIHLHYPDYYTKISLINHYCNKYNIELPQKMIEHLAYKLNGDVRYIQSSIEKLAFYQINPSTLNKTEIDFILEPFYDKSNFIDIDIIIQVVCEHYKISKEDILSKKKNKRVSLVRHIIAYLSVKLANNTLSYVAKYLKRNDHTGILYAIKKIEDLLQKDLFLKNELEVLKEKIYLYSQNK
ncbi:MAG: chromosomal replication initiator protein DnaA [Leptospiraceae bacterium]|nr:MAG: chromosomal replication initiator protein DnaA [Leptospiraceae bacterium]